jgi:hypothetical protein
VAVITLVSACSTAPTANTDKSESYDFAQSRTFTVVGDGHLNNPMISDLDRQRMNRALTNELEIQGRVAVDEKSADILISYFVVTKDKVKVNSSYTGGYSRYGYGRGMGVSHTSARNYVEGTIVIDVIDNSSQNAVWRSTLTKTIKNYDSSEQRDAEIASLINIMLADFPI